jgi:hypothetical protein
VLFRGAPLAWRSHKQARVARSTCRAELLALDECVDYLNYLQALLRPLWRDSLTLSVYTDAQDVLDLLASAAARPAERSLIAKVKSLQGKTAVVPTLAIVDRVEEGRIALRKVATDSNLADGLTKPMATTALLDLQQYLGAAEPCSSPARQRAASLPAAPPRSRSACRSPGRATAHPGGAATGL